MDERIKRSPAPQFGNLVYRSILRIHQSDMDGHAKSHSLYRLIRLVLEELTQDERIHFTTQFARIAYVGSRFSLSGKLLYGLHFIRKKFESFTHEEIEEIYLLSLYCASHLIKESVGQTILPALREILPTEIPLKPRKIEIKKFEAFLRVIALKSSGVDSELEVIVEGEEYAKRTLVIDRVERNSLFSASLKRLAKSRMLPVHLHLINTEIDLESKLHPQAIIIDPDYLIDVTTIAGCFKSFGSDPRMHLLQKFLPVTSNIHLILGNIANFILDEVISYPKIEFQELKQKLFRLDPLGFALFEDKLIRELLQKVQLHFVHLKKVILRDFSKLGISRSAVYLEPSFYSPRYGLQGRLDVFHHEASGQTDIIELKSGRVYRPNAYGLNQNHYIQTILYDLLVKETVPKNTRITSYILYSAEENRNLRFAPAVAAKQFEALAVRNALVETEMHLAQNKEWLSKILSSFQSSNFPKASGFLKRDILRFESAYQSLDPLEKEYFESYVGFCFRELRLAKTGSDELDQLNGMAGLWMNSEDQKQDQFVILNHLTITSNNSDEKDPILVLEKTEQTTELAKFRVGDIVVLYPDKKGSRGDILSSQVFKCTIVSLELQTIAIRLRSIQKNQTFFDQHPFWNLEYDFMESSFNSMFRGLFEFAESRQDYRQLIMGQRPPAQVNNNEEILPPNELNHEQAQIFQEIINAADYYLLWGPPGTGKTSRLIKNLVAYLMEETEERILVIAYTNRAVDELCEAISSVNRNMINRMLRIGSRYSVNEKFRDILLSQKMERIESRKHLVSMLSKKRLVCGTLASIIGKDDLFKLLHFDRVIIDEASQILEPMLVGFLSRFPKRILVGDHLQLPAVVIQNERSSSIQSGSLSSIGLKNTRNSLFERLYLRCCKNKWDWAIGQLSQQGRMHEDIMKFPNQHFYNGSLKIIPGLERLVAPQNFTTVDPNEIPLTKERMIFIPCEVADEELHFKTNQSESEAIVKLLRLYSNLLSKNNYPFQLKDIGIITPFRAQIAKIRRMLDEGIAEKAKQVTVDTVERYQGGARDVIIISFCANHWRQLKMIQSISAEGIDRKLNVALTRAKEQIIILGSESVLTSQDQMKELIHSCFTWSDFFKEHTETSDA